VYLVDTNIWLERLLDQAGSEEVGQFLQRVSNDRLYLSDFTLHSIGIILLKLDEAATFARFVQDVLIDGVVRLVALQPEDMTNVTDAAERNLARAALGLEGDRPRLHFLGLAQRSARLAAESTVGYPSQRKPMVLGAFPSWTNVRAAYRAVGGRDGRPDAFDSARVDDPGKPGRSPVLFLPRGTYPITKTLIPTSRINVNIVLRIPAACLSSGTARLAGR